VSIPLADSDSNSLGQAHCEQIWFQTCCLDRLNVFRCVILVPSLIIPPTHSSFFYLLRPGLTPRQPLFRWLVLNYHAPGKIDLRRTVSLESSETTAIL
jgi:hypothetical protein